MSKRRKENEEEEDKPFKVPKFDEEAFLKRERRHIKAAFVAFIFGCLMALVCFGFWALMGSNEGFRWPLVLFVSIVYMFSIKYFFLRLQIDISEFTKGKLFITYGTYFFTWLIIFIVLVNPPFYDDEAPLVDLAVLPDMQEFGSPVKIVAKITDNAGVEKSGIVFTINGQIIDNNDFEFANDIFVYEFPSPTNDSADVTYDFELKVNDTSNIQTIQIGSFTYSNDTVTVADPPGVRVLPGPEVSYATSIKIRVNCDANRVYYTINDGIPINVTQKEGDYYVTYPEYQGWPKNENVTMKVFAQVNYTYPIVTNVPIQQMSKEQLEEVQDEIDANTFGVTIVDSHTYYFIVDDGSLVGTKSTGSAGGLEIVNYVVPGFEAIVLLVALFVVILIFKKKNKDEKKQK